MKEKILAAINQGFCMNCDPSPNYTACYSVFVDSGQYSVVFRGEKMRATKIDATQSYPDVVNEIEVSFL